MSHADEILSVKNIFKVFGPNPNMAMEMLRKGADKNEIFSKTGHVVGVFDASFSVKRGEISGPCHPHFTVNAVPARGFRPA